MGVAGAPPASKPSSVAPAVTVSWPTASTKGAQPLSSTKSSPALEIADAAGAKAARSKGAPPVALSAPICSCGTPAKVASDHSVGWTKAPASTAPLKLVPEGKAPPAPVPAPLALTWHKDISAAARGEARAPAGSPPVSASASDVVAVSALGVPTAKAPAPPSLTVTRPKGGDGAVVAAVTVATNAGKVTVSAQRPKTAMARTKEATSKYARESEVLKSDSSKVEVTLDKQNEKMTPSHAAGPTPPSATTTVAVTASSTPILMAESGTVPTASPASSGTATLTVASPNITATTTCATPTENKTGTFRISFMQAGRLNPQSRSQSHSAKARAARRSSGDLSDVAPPLEEPSPHVQLVPFSDKRSSELLREASSRKEDVALGDKIRRTCDNSSATLVETILSQKESQGRESDLDNVVSVKQSTSKLENVKSQLSAPVADRISSPSDKMTSQTQVPIQNVDKECTVGAVNKDTESIANVSGASVSVVPTANVEEKNQKLVISCEKSELSQGSSNIREKSIETSDVSHVKCTESGNFQPLHLGLLGGNAQDLKECTRFENNSSDSHIKVSDPCSTEGHKDRSHSQVTSPNSVVSQNRGPKTHEKQRLCESSSEGKEIEPHFVKPTSSCRASIDSLSEKNGISGTSISERSNKLLPCSEQSSGRPRIKHEPEENKWAKDHVSSDLYLSKDHHTSRDHHHHNDHHSSRDHHSEHHSSRDHHNPSDHHSSREHKHRSHHRHSSHRSSSSRDYSSHGHHSSRHSTTGTTHSSYSHGSHGHHSRGHHGSHGNSRSHSQSHGRSAERSHGHHKHRTPPRSVSSDDRHPKAEGGEGGAPRPQQHVQCSLPLARVSGILESCQSLAKASANKRRLEQRLSTLPSRARASSPAAPAPAPPPAPASGSSSSGKAHDADRSGVEGLGKVADKRSPAESRTRSVDSVAQKEGDVPHGKATADGSVREAVKRLSVDCSPQKVEGVQQSKSKDVSKGVALKGSDTQGVSNAKVQSSESLQNDKATPLSASEKSTKLPQDSESKTDVDIKQASASKSAQEEKTQNVSFTSIKLPSDTNTMTVALVNAHKDMKAPLENHTSESILRDVEQTPINDSDISKKSLLVNAQNSVEVSPTKTDITSSETSLPGTEDELKISKSSDISCSSTHKDAEASKVSHKKFQDPAAFSTKINVSIGTPPTVAVKSDVSDVSKDIDSPANKLEGHDKVLAKEPACADQMIHENEKITSLKNEKNVEKHKCEASDSVHLSDNNSADLRLSVDKESKDHMEGNERGLSNNAQTFDGDVSAKSSEKNLTETVGVKDKDTLEKRNEVELTTESSRDASVSERELEQEFPAVKELETKDSKKTEDVEVPGNSMKDPETSPKELTSKETESDLKRAIQETSCENLPMKEDLVVEMPSKVLISVQEVSVKESLDVKESENTHLKPTCEKQVETKKQAESELEVQLSNEIPTPDTCANSQGEPIAEISVNKSMKVTIETSEKNQHTDAKIEAEIVSISVSKTSTDEKQNTDAIPDKYTESIGPIQSDNDLLHKELPEASSTEMSEKSVEVTPAEKLTIIKTSDEYSAGSISEEKTTEICVLETPPLPDITRKKSTEEMSEKYSVEEKLEKCSTNQKDIKKSPMKHKSPAKEEKLQHKSRGRSPKSTKTIRVSPKKEISVEKSPISDHSMPLTPKQKSAKVSVKKNREESSLQGTCSYEENIVEFSPSKESTFKNEETLENSNTDGSKKKSNVEEKHSRKLLFEEISQEKSAAEVTAPNSELLEERDISISPQLSNENQESSIDIEVPDSKNLAARDELMDDEKRSSQTFPVTLVENKDASESLSLVEVLNTDEDKNEDRSTEQKMDGLQYSENETPKEKDEAFTLKEIERTDVESNLPDKLLDQRKDALLEPRREESICETVDVNTIDVKNNELLKPSSKDEVETHSMEESGTTDLQKQKSSDENTNKTVAQEDGSDNEKKTEKCSGRAVIAKKSPVKGKKEKCKEETIEKSCTEEIVEKEMDNDTPSESAGLQSSSKEIVMEKARNKEKSNKKSKKEERKLEERLERSDAQNSDKDNTRGKETIENEIPRQTLLLKEARAAKSVAMARILDKSPSKDMPIRNEKDSLFSKQIKERASVGSDIKNADMDTSEEKYPAMKLEENVTINLPSSEKSGVISGKLKVKKSPGLEKKSRSERSVGEVKRLSIEASVETLVKENTSSEEETLKEIAAKDTLKKIEKDGLVGSSDNFTEKTYDSSPVQKCLEERLSIQNENEVPLKCTTVEKHKRKEASSDIPNDELLDKSEDIREKTEESTVVPLEEVPIFKHRRSLRNRKKDTSVEKQTPETKKTPELETTVGKIVRKKDSKKDPSSKDTTEKSSDSPEALVEKSTEVITDEKSVIQTTINETSVNKTTETEKVTGEESGNKTPSEIVLSTEQPSSENLDGTPRVLRTQDYLLPPSNKFLFQEEQAHFLDVGDGQRLYACDICVGVYQRKFSLKRHYLRTHINRYYLTERDINNCGITKTSQDTPDTTGNNAEKNVAETTQARESSISVKADGITEIQPVKDPSKLGLFCCYLCNEYYDTKIDLKNHLENHQPTVVPNTTATDINKLYTCEKCNSVFTQKTSYVRHCVAEHDSTSPVPSPGPIFTDKEKDGKKKSSAPSSPAHTADKPKESKKKSSAPSSPAHTADKSKESKRKGAPSPSPLTTAADRVKEGIKRRTASSSPVGRSASLDKKHKRKTSSACPSPVPALAMERLDGKRRATASPAPGLPAEADKAKDEKEGRRNLTLGPCAAPGCRRPPSATKEGARRHLPRGARRRWAPLVVGTLCLYCNLDFASPSARRRHQSRVHLNQKKHKRPQERCQFCNSRFRDLRVLLEHCLAEHADVYFACGPCEERFQTRQLLRAHAKGHELRDPDDRKDKEKDKERERALASSSSSSRSQSPCCHAEAAVRPPARPASAPGPSWLARRDSPLPRDDFLMDPETLFYSRLSCNIRENLLHHLVGKVEDLPGRQREPSPSGDASSAPAPAPASAPGGSPRPRTPPRRTAPPRLAAGAAPHRAFWRSTTSQELQRRARGLAVATSRTCRTYELLTQITCARTCTA
ncbi:Protein of unknown function [Gryllus bimaculatus]|nr:Protein of unknown function [Gryllus bimaculatus]